MKITGFLAGLLLASSVAAHAAPGRLAEISLLDRASGRELPVHWHDGGAYVVGQPGNEYQVVIRSHTGEDLLAVVSVDGVNVLSGETASTQQGGYIVSPWGRIAIKGWRKSLDETAAFYFTSLGDSYAGRTGRPQSVGVIGVALFQRKRSDPPAGALDLRVPSPLKRESANAPRAPAPEVQGMPSAPAAPLGTGHGRREESRVHWVEFERATEQPIETVAIYYDSYRNLVARGILQPSPRDPQPFPAGFVPDPR